MGGSDHQFVAKTAAIGSSSISLVLLFNMLFQELTSQRENQARQSREVFRREIFALLALIALNAALFVSTLVLSQLESNDHVGTPRMS